MKKYLFLLCLCALALVNCSKDKHIPAAPSMVLTVTDEAGNKLKGAVALLYEDYHDWFSMDNPIAAGVADEQGEILFENMDEKVYFFDVTYDDTYWNYPEGIYRTENSLKKGYRKKLSVILYESEEDITKR
ncbi:hypothetical protein [uncultured Alistipes sp.]|jgi:hypothetical protein|uniref:hypothetical protein n=1 Tax=uncultured Alistipes sp. TaxID=538949 RepID=UPI0025D59C0C|nr:hypothetical protein [uncultured Alistipes sp.]